MLEDYKEIKSKENNEKLPYLEVGISYPLQFYSNKANYIGYYKEPTCRGEYVFSFQNERKNKYAFYIDHWTRQFKGMITYIPVCSYRPLIVSESDLVDFANFDKIKSTFTNYKKFKYTKRVVKILKILGVKI